MQNYNKHIKILRDKCDVFLKEVEAIGNECAYTDRLLEDILEYADKVKQVYEQDGEETMNNRISAIAEFAQRRDDEITAKQKQAEDREEFLKQTILGWHDRIQQLIDTANACLKHGIKFWHTWANDHNYDHGYFITDACSHILGFELKHYNSSSITRIGKKGGGYDHYDIFTDGKTIEATGDDRLWALERFVEKFDEFETKFYDYVDRICKSK